MGMAVSQTLEELLHVAFDLRDGEALPRVGESSEIVVTKLHDHVNRAFALVVVGGCGEAHAATATARCGVSDRKKKGDASAPPPPPSGRLVERSGAVRGALGKKWRKRAGRAPFDVTISLSLTTFLWLRIFKILISRIAVIGNCAGRRARRLLRQAHVPANDGCFVAV